MLHLEIAVALQHLAHQMPGAAGAGRAIEGGRGLRARPGDEFRHGGGRHRGMDQDHRGHQRAQADGGEVALDGMLRAVLVLHHRAGGRKGGVVEQQHLPIRRRLGDDIGADGATTPAAVFHQDGNAQCLGQALAIKPGQDVRGAARGEGHNNADWPVRRPGLRAGHQRGGQGGSQEMTAAHHSTRICKDCTRGRMAAIWPCTCRVNSALELPPGSAPNSRMRPATAG